MKQRNLENLTKHLTLLHSIEYDNIKSFVFVNSDLLINTELLVADTEVALYDTQKPMFKHQWNLSNSINFTLANDDVLFTVSMMLNHHNRIEYVFIKEHNYGAAHKV